MSKIDPDVYEFVNFMKSHYHTDKTKPITHTLMGVLHDKLARYRGRYCIEGVDYEKFMNLYNNVSDKMELHVVERPKTVGPIIIDIDFKTAKKHSERQYLDTHIEDIVKIYNNLFKKYLNVNDDQIKAFVFEKPTPTYVEKDKEWKDGFHILYPELPMDVKKRYFFFDKAKDEIIENDVFNDIPYINTYEKILDASVVNSNGILMYKSCKEGREPYSLTKVYTHDMQIEKTDEYEDDDLVNYFSLRRFCEEDDIPFKKTKSTKLTKLSKSHKSSKSHKYDSDSENEMPKNTHDSYSDQDEFETFENVEKSKYYKSNNSDFDSDSDADKSEVEADEADEVDNEVDKIYEKYENTKHKLKKKQKKMEDYDENDRYDEDNPNQNKYKNGLLHEDQPLGRTEKWPSQFQTTGKLFEIEIAKEILKILKRNRWDDYHEWIRVGWALHGVSPSLLKDYINFSKRSKKFKPGECEEIWRNADSYDKDELGIGSLQWWAREDNLEAYLQILRKCMNPLINEAKSGTHDDIANVMKEMYKHMYKCINIQKNIWYEFQGHGWVLLDSAYTLKDRIPSEVVKEFFVLHSSHIASAGGTMAVDQDEHIKQSGKIQKLYEKLKNNGFQKQVVEACTSKFYDKKFEEKLNTNPLLLGFKNGVYDLGEMRFRNGTPDDLISMNTGYDYKEYDANSPEVKKVEKYFSQVQRDEDVRNYVLRLISSFLDGRVKDQKFILWTGHGCHAKGEEILMYDGTTKQIQDIKLKDNVLGPDGRPRRVIATYTGKSAMYTVHVEDKKSTKFKITSDHRLALRNHFKPFVYETYDNIYEVKLFWVCYHILTSSGPVKMEDKFYNYDDAEKFMKNLETKEDFIEYGKIFPLAASDCDTISSSIIKYYKLCKIGNDMSTDVDFTLQYHKISDEEYFGIELDGDKKYVMKNGYVTYNSNGKSTTISLIHDTLGEYSSTLASQVVTRKRGGAGQATPDLADKMGKRFLAIQEPEPDDQIYVGQMKELSAGNDKIAARALYGNPFYYKPQFKMVLCCNKLPNIPSNDGGTWRRLRVTPWTTQFVDRSVEKLEPHQFYKDPYLEDNMKKWPQPFIWLLLKKYYPDYIKNGLGEPKTVTQFTDKYKKDSDVYLEFLTDWTEDPEDPEYEESVNVMYKLFKIWYKEAYSTLVPPQKEFVNYLESKFVVDKRKVRGIKLKVLD